jgi:hypothetical protein
MNWRGEQAKQFCLLMITGLVVACVWHHRHWDSWEDTLAYWFAGAMVVAVTGATGWLHHIFPTSSSLAMTTKICRRERSCFSIL